MHCVSAFLIPLLIFPERKARIERVTRISARRYAHVTICMSSNNENEHGMSARRNLELNWRFQDENNRKAVQCESCRGTGLAPCQWCNATGVMMLGDKLVCSIDGNSKCVLCDDGHVRCATCRGNGMIAAWLYTKT